MQDIFNKIVSREIPSHIIWEDENHLAFLDINPLQKGHTLVIPKRQTDYIFDMDNTSYQSLMIASKKVADLLKDKLGCKRVCVIIEGYAVPHTHIHLIPTNSATDLDKENKIITSENYFTELESILGKID